MPKNWHKICKIGIFQKKYFSRKSNSDLLIRFSFCGYCGVRQEYHTRKTNNVQDSEDGNEHDRQGLPQEPREHEPRVQEGFGRRLQGDRESQKVFLKVLTPFSRYVILAG